MRVFATQSSDLIFPRSSFTKVQRAIRYVGHGIIISLMHEVRYKKSLADGNFCVAPVIRIKMTPNFLRADTIPQYAYRLHMKFLLRLFV